MGQTRKHDRDVRTTKKSSVNFSTNDAIAFFHDDGRRHDANARCLARIKSPRRTFDFLWHVTELAI